LAARQLLVCHGFRQVFEPVCHRHLLYDIGLKYNESHYL
jgi:hypothetical protein